MLDVADADEGIGSREYGAADGDASGKIDEIGVVRERDDEDEAGAANTDEDTNGFAVAEEDEEQDEKTRGNFVVAIWCPSSTFRFFKGSPSLFDAFVPHLAASQKSRAA